MRLLITILTLSIGTNCFAFSHFDILRDTFQQGFTLKEFEVKLSSKFQDFKLRRQNNIIARKLDFGFSQQVYDVQINYNGNYLKFFQFFLVINSNDSIILGTLQELDYYGKTKKSENYIENDSQIASYLAKHKINYNTNLSKKELITQLTELIIYGFGCSDGGGYNPPKAKEMISYLKKKNYNRLSGWLRQISPELQAYAVHGLLQLHKKGVQIKQSDKDLIEQLKQRNSDIYHCSGCLYGLSTTIAYKVQSLAKCR